MPSTSFFLDSSRNESFLAMDSAELARPRGLAAVVVEVGRDG